MVVSICLAFSATYELIEWMTAVISGGGATAFLGTQGDVDTQWEMSLALIGAMTSFLVLSRVHTRKREGLTPGTEVPRLGVPIGVPNGYLLKALLQSSAHRRDVLRTSNFSRAGLSD